MVWSAVLERFERQAPASVMARAALEHALPAGWVDEVFEAHRERQYGSPKPPGRPDGFHLQPTEPCVNLSIYTARPNRTLVTSR